jgi:acetylornithine deacetylase
MTDNERRVLRCIDDMAAEIVACLQEMIRLPSENTPPTGAEGPFQAYMADRMRRLGLEVDTFRPDEVPGIESHPAWLAGRDYTDRPNVVGFDPGLGESATETGRSLLVLGHADVERAGARELWQHDPWLGEIENGQVYGRGAGDDKGGLCTAVMALEALRRCGLRPRGRLALASVVDEEQGGSNGTLAVLVRGHTADAGLYVDGVNLRGELAYVGGGNFFVDVRQTGGYRPVEETLAYLADVCRALRRDGEERYRRILQHPGYEDNEAASRGSSLGTVCAGDGIGDLIQSGRVEAWAYALPGEETAEQMLAAVRRHLDATPGIGDRADFTYDLRWQGRFLQPSRISGDEPIARCLADSFHDATGSRMVLGSAEMSDAPIMNRYGAHPTIGFGIARWLGEGAVHSPDEAVSIEDELLPACRTVALTIMRWCGHAVEASRE